MNYLVLSTTVGTTTTELPIVFPESVSAADLVTALLTVPGLTTATVVAAGQCLSDTVLPQCEGQVLGVGVSRGQTDNALFANYSRSKGTGHFPFPSA